MKYKELNGFQKEIFDVLHKLGYKITFDVKYGGPEVNVYAENRDGGKKLFISGDPEISLDHGHAQELHSIRAGNKKMDRNIGCEYILIGEGGASKGAINQADTDNILLYKDLKQFKTEFPKYLSNLV